MAKKNTTKKETKKTTPVNEAVTNSAPLPQEQVSENNPSNDDEDLPAIPEQNMKERVRRKTGGRQKGSVNKVTSITKAVISDLLSDYQESGLMGSDFLALEPKDRFQCAEKLMQYIMPKMQSTALDLGKQDVTITIEQKLRDLAKDPDEE